MVMIGYYWYIHNKQFKIYLKKILILIDETNLVCYCFQCALAQVVNRFLRTIPIAWNRCNPLE